MSGVYVWDMTHPDNACGVASREADAVQALAESLRDAPVGAEGIIRGAVIPMGLRHGYTYSDPIVTGRHAADGTVVWTDGEGAR